MLAPRKRPDNLIALSAKGSPDFATETQMLEATLINWAPMADIVGLPFEIEFASIGEAITVRPVQTAVEAQMESTT